MKDKKNMLMVVVIGIAIVLFMCFNNTAFATTGVVTTNDLRLREEESTSSKILAVLNENDEVEIIGNNGDWYKVKANNQVGYVNKSYIKVKETNVIPEEKVSENTNKITEEDQNKNLEEVKSENNETTNQDAQSKEMAQLGTVSADSQIRVLPVINSDVIQETKTGEKYKIVSNVGLWSYVKSNDKCGWVLNCL